MHYPSLVATDALDSSVYPLDFSTVHKQGVPHRAVHLEIVNRSGNYFIWHRADGRLEIPGGHVEWLESENRPESYEEAALRELIEELNLPFNWKLSPENVQARLLGRLLPVARMVNQLPSSHGNNNEWLTVYSLFWQDDWEDPCKFGYSEEGNSDAWWLSITEIQRMSLKNPMGINAALRLFLSRRSVLVPLVYK